MSCTRAKCEFRVDRNGDQREFGTFCSHTADTVNRYDGQPQCPFHEDAIPLREYENPVEYYEEEIDKTDWPYT